MNQIYARAWQRANQNMTYGQVSLTKPDNVLEYICYDQSLGITANQISNIFSTSQKFAGYEYDFHQSGTSVAPSGKGILNVFLGEDYTNKALKKLVLNDLNKDRDNNFAHALLGGTAEGLGSEGPLQIGDGSYTCTLMSTVETLSRCSNFGTDDQFFTLDELAETDPRIYPQACPSEDKATDYSDLAENKNSQYVNYDSPSGYPGYLQTGSCAAPIPTGLTVYQYQVDTSFDGPVRRKGNDWPDNICSTPGCYYDPTSGSCKL